MHGKLMMLAACVGAICAIALPLAVASAAFTDTASGTYGACPFSGTSTFAFVPKALTQKDTSVGCSGMYLHVHAYFWDSGLNDYVYMETGYIAQTTVSVTYGGSSNFIYGYHNMYDWFTSSYSQTLSTHAY